jgi:threonine/homoserine/homoserine lactone efflux protein
MPPLPLFLAFLAAATVLTLTPGVDTAMVLRSAVASGARAGALAGIGIALGCLVWGGLVSAGLGAVLRVSAAAYDVVKFAGAGYLVWLGVRLVWRPREALDGAGTQSTGWAALRRGFLTNMLNPKVGVFYVTFLPQFIPAGANVAVCSFLLACVHVALTLVWFGVLIAGTVKLQGLLRRRGVVRALDRLSGCVFIGFGVRLAASAAWRGGSAG